MASNRSELVVVYGRRRVGKTFLIEQFSNKEFAFRYVGVHGLNTKRQLQRFAHELAKYSQVKTYRFTDWFEAFDALQDYLDTLPSNKKKTVFIDEMPWMDTGRSDFVIALENFWNGWATSQEDIMLIATGSATSRMRDKLVSNQGGLHARITCHIHLSPFSLGETEAYMHSMGVNWDRYQLLQAYMLLGGVPYYYSILDTSISLAQNIDKLCFFQDGRLRIEFYELYNALFSSSDLYINVVRLLSQNKGGLTFQEIGKTLKMENGYLTKVLTNLERCDFVERWAQYGNTKRQEVFRLVDFYTLFYFQFIEGQTTKNDTWWTNNIGSPTIRAWMGICFELVCMRHHREIKKALGISGISTTISTWNCKANDKTGTRGAQIDMIIERADRIVHLCEMKFSEGEYRITAEYEKKLRERMETFRLVTKNTKSLVNTFITTYGVANGIHHGIVNSELKMEQLFAQ